MARAKITEADHEIVRYRALVDAGADVDEVAAWITEAKTQRLAAEGELHQTTSVERLEQEQVKF